MIRIMIYALLTCHNGGKNEITILVGTLVPNFDRCPHVSKPNDTAAVPL